MQKYTSPEVEQKQSQLKIKQFESTLKNFPRIIDDLNSDADVDFIALAQHSGLNTNLI